MLAVQNTLVSDLVLEKKFVCDLNACKGACCIEGDSGAPVEEHEKAEMLRAYPSTKKYMSGEGVEAVEKQGLFVPDTDNEYGTTLINNERCAFVYFENNIAKCAFEKAYNNGESTFKKPISCHLYPIRIKKIKDFEAVNYHEWDICKPACSCGDQLNVRVYRFLKEPLIRKFGEEWYTELDELANEYLINKMK